jgi:hypothetical protein
VGLKKKSGQSKKPSMGKSKLKKGAFRMWIFVAIMMLAAIMVQLILGWLSKNEFTVQNFAIVVPLFVLTQYLISLGYHDGTEQTNFITAHILWTAALVVGTLIANYFIFQTIPTPLNIFALVLAATAAVISVLGK